jgi:phosphate/sulfate permease
MCRGIPASQAPAFRIMMMAMMIIAIIAIIIIIIITTTHRCIVSAIHAIIQVFIVHVKRQA